MNKVIIWMFTYGVRVPREYDPIYTDLNLFLEELPELCAGA
jgi:hypothetical protein